MKKDILKMSPPESLAFVRRIWKKLQKKGMASLSGEEKKYAQIMLDHQAVFDLHEAFSEPADDLDDPEHPVFHILVHATIEEQLQYQDPEEAVSFFKSMHARDLDPHEIIHLMGMIFQYAIFSNLGEPDTVIDEKYQSLLTEHLQGDPEEIAIQMEENLQELIPDPGLLDFLFDYETIDSDTARHELDDIIDQVAESGNPVGIRSATGSEAIIVPAELIDIFSDMQRILSATGQTPGDPLDIDQLSISGKTERTAIEQPLPLSHAYKDVLQLKISLKGAKPPIWRRIQIPADYTFWDLHVAIQDAMGWEDAHLHEFSVKNRLTGTTLQIGLPAEFEADLDLPGIDVKYGWTCRVSDYLTPDNQRVTYVYDFGDDWMHEILLEDILPRTIGVDYPICLKGKRACPPEDCGGLPGYQDMLRLLEDPDHPEYEPLIEWLGDDFDPAVFDKSEIRFSDPRKYLQQFLD